MTAGGAKLARRLGGRDAVLIVMGGIVGSGIFMNPSVVARIVGSGSLVMAVWIAGGAIALLGAGVFAELAARRPRDGGQYAYLRDAFHPALAFIFGWTLLLVSQSGGMAAAAVTFANYFAPLTGFHGSHGQITAIAVAAIAVFTAVNALGVRSGTTTQNLFMVAKILAIAGFAVIGLFVVRSPGAVAVAAPQIGGSTLAVIGLAMVPVLFAYSGWQTSSFMTAELHQPHRTLARGMIAGVVIVVLLYLAVNATCLRALGIGGLAATNTPASDVARLAFGPVGLRVMAIVIAISTLGFLSNQILTSPRVYFQMAADGTFFKQLARVNAAHPRARDRDRAAGSRGDRHLRERPVRSDPHLRDVQRLHLLRVVRHRVASLSQSRRGRSAGRACRRSECRASHLRRCSFLAVAWSVVGDSMWKSPLDTSVGIAILLSGLPVYWFFSRRKAAAASA